MVVATVKVCMGLQIQFKKNNTGGGGNRRIIRGE